jgi:pimeloyl-ACP methyl ester carboxylesterase
VLLEELAAVELRDAFEEERRRRLVARHALILARLIGPVFYLHGFASSAKSTKAGYFAARLQERGVALQCPDFNEPDFATLTMTRMLDQLGRALPDEEGTSATLIGSSLGGALAVLAAARWPDRVGRLVLLAPAVMIAKPGHHLLPPEKMDEWRRQGTLPFFHYAYGEERPLDYGFHLDTQRQDPVEASFTQPTLIFQGLHDRSVDHTTVEAFARSRSNVTLSLLEDDHQLIASLPVVWDGIAHWLGLAA